MKTKPILIISLLISSCAVLPETPQGSFCVLDVSDDVANCVPMDPKSLTPTHDVPYKLMQGYIAMDEDSWVNLQTYIRQLRSRLLEK